MVTGSVEFGTKLVPLPNDRQPNVPQRSGTVTPAEIFKYSAVCLERICSLKTSRAPGGPISAERVTALSICKRLLDALTYGTFPPRVASVNCCNGPQWLEYQKTSSPSRIFG